MIPKNDILALLEACSRQISFNDFIPVSGKTGENCGLVLEKIKQILPQGPEYFPQDQLTDKNERFVVAELIREQVLRLCREEIPHSVAVEVHTFADNPGRKTLIQATIFLERDAQKKIVIGRDGKMLKDIGSSARVNVEEFIGRKVYLELWVKVQENWRKDEIFLRRLGYEK
ncbi:MAG: GTPase Era [Candidatus Omnitrophota bacterium]